MQAVYIDHGTRGSKPLGKVLEPLPVLLIACVGSQAIGEPSTNEALRGSRAGVDHPTVFYSNNEKIFLAFADSLHQSVHNKSAVCQCYHRVMI